MTEGCQVKKPWHRAGRPNHPKHKLLSFFSFYFPKRTFARVFPVEICNLYKIKWVTSCRCVYELETLWSKQLQRPDSNHKHRGSTKFIRGGRVEGGHIPQFAMGFHHSSMNESSMWVLWLVANAGSVRNDRSLSSEVQLFPGVLKIMYNDEIHWLEKSEKS